jgi:hypothetical protein
LLNDQRFYTINNDIDKIVDFECTKKHKLNLDKFEFGFSIKTNSDDSLENSRKTLIQLLDRILDYSVYLSNLSNTPIKVEHSNKRDFYLLIKLKPTKNKILFKNPNDSYSNYTYLAAMFKNKTSESFVKIKLLKQSIQFSSKSLLNLNERVNETKDDIYKISNM